MLYKLKSHFPLFHAAKGYIKRKGRQPIPSAPESQKKLGQEKKWKKMEKDTGRQKENAENIIFHCHSPVAIILIRSDGHG